MQLFLEGIKKMNKYRVKYKTYVISMCGNQYIYGFDKWQLISLEECFYKKIEMTDKMIDEAIEEYKRDDVVEAYRNYYNREKHYDKNGKNMFIWTKRIKPEWLND